MRFSQKENRRLGEQIEAALGRCLLDMRVRPGGSHHQKFVVLRHPGRPGLDVAFVGGIDLCHRRRDDVAHAGDPQALPIAAVYGDRPPGPDAHVAIRGPAVGDAGAVFRERWQDPSPLSRNPVRRLRALPGHEGTQACVLPAPLPFPGACGPHAVQLLPTHPDRRRGYGFTPHGGAQHRTQLHQGAAPGQGPDRPGGSVPMVEAGRQAVRRRAGSQSGTAHDRHPAALGRSGRGLRCLPHEGKPS
jgi:phosphatidylserine/phosphatidylglycerophosphate/cardiolipin synthase-like enzyme